MDKCWMNFSRVDPRYFQGIEDFIKFVSENCNTEIHPCPCRLCKGGKNLVDLGKMRRHLLKYGMMKSYKIWTLHGEEIEPLEVMYEPNDAQVVGRDQYMTMELLNDTFPLRDFSTNDMMGETSDHAENKVAYEKYRTLMEEAQKPIFLGSEKNVLNCILEGLQVKVESRWSDKSFDKHLAICRGLLPQENNYPRSYREVKKVLKKLGLSYDIYHACEYGCVLYYKELEHYDICPVCEEPRYAYENGKRKVPKKIVRYFPITPRLKRLYMSPHVAKEMRWHGERRVGDGESDFRHPADGEAWNHFNMEFPEFANEIRNIRLGLATDGFNPFGINSTSHSTWPIVVMSYNLPPSMCMKKEFNILAMLISGPKSPGKCLNVFMKPLIDELNMLWSSGVSTYDCYSGTCFNMRAAVLWTISDFPGLGMLGGVQTKGYKACPVCLDGIDAVHSDRRMSYQGHRRWLPRDHDWRRASDKFGGQVELRDKPPSPSGVDILDLIQSHSRDFPVLSLHPHFRAKGKAEKLCWTHESIFYELPYWKYLAQPYSLDVMHIEKNVFDCVIGAVLGLEGKRHLWDMPSGRPCYTIHPDNKIKVLEMLKDVEYPSYYAGSLRSKVNLQERKFVGLKTHDIHVMFQRLIPVFIRPHLPTYVVNPVVSLCQWFQRLCCRELTKTDVFQLKADIILILCHFERFFPPAFFTIMVHLMVHLPDQVLLKGPVHYSWMYPIERQLGEYKKYVRNTRFPEGCIAEQYITQECVTYVKIYMENKAPEESNMASSINVSGYIPSMKLSKSQLRSAHWCVIEHCDEAKYYVDYHKREFEEQYPFFGEGARIKHFSPYLKHWVCVLVYFLYTFYFVYL